MILKGVGGDALYHVKNSLDFIIKLASSANLSYNVYTLHVSSPNIKTGRLEDSPAPST